MRVTPNTWLFGSLGLLVIAFMASLTAGNWNGVGSTAVQIGSPMAGSPVAGSPVAGTPVAIVVAPASVGSNAQQPADFAYSLLPGTPDTVSVVASYPITTGSDGTPLTMVLIRNATTQPVTSVSIAGTIRNESGQLVAAGSNETTWPAIIQPGEYANAIVQFQGAVPSRSIGEYATSAGPVATYSSEVSLEITEASDVGGTIIGFVRNPGTSTAYQAVLAGSCFDAAGAMTNWFTRPLENTSLEPNQLSAFSVAFNTPGCANWVLTAGT